MRLRLILIFQFRHLGETFFFSILVVPLIGLVYSEQAVVIYIYINLIILDKSSYLIKPSYLPFDKVVFWVYFFDLPMAMNKAMALKLGNVVGTFEDVICDKDGYCWGTSLRMRITIYIMKPFFVGLS